MGTPLLVSRSADAHHGDLAEIPGKIRGMMKSLAG
jgi:hypothetical protein